MAHMVPKEMLEFDPKSREDVIFKALRGGLNDEYWVFHSFNVNQTSQNGAFYEKEVDFLVSLRAGEKAELPCVIRDSDCKLTLYKNCRNTNAIATSAARGILAHGKSPEIANV